jgi:lysophospholipase L1-like esterase
MMTLRFFTVAGFNEPGIRARRPGSLNPAAATGFLRAFCVALAIATLVPVAVAAPKVLVLGDSLSAEYKDMPEYGEVTRNGWQAKNWVEILAARSAGALDFGDYRALPQVWDIYRLHGYRFNWGFPGAEAEDFENRLTDPNDPFRYTLRPTLAGQLRNNVEWVVVFLGANDFREAYGQIYDGGDPNPLINEIEHSVEAVVNYVQAVNGNLKIVLVNIPDVGAAPGKIAAHPDPDRRALVTRAIRRTNFRLAGLAVEKGLALANIYVETRRLIEGKPVIFAGQTMICDSDPDNDPRYLFTRDDFHPNTALQIRIGQQVLRAMNGYFGAGLPLIPGGEALRILGLR